MCDNNNSEINLNLRMPSDQVKEGTVISDLIITIYNERRVFFTFCLLGLVAGILAAGFYYFTHRDSLGDKILAVPIGDVTITLTLNYQYAEELLFPSGATFNAKSIVTVDIVEKAICAIGISGITAADILPRLIVECDEVYPNIYTVTLLGMNGDFAFTSEDEKVDFLQSLATEYRRFINEKYFLNENTIGYLHGQHLGTIDSEIRTIELWTPDPFSFEKGFSHIMACYTTIGEILEEYHKNDPVYTSANGLSFREHENEINEIVGKEIAAWMERLNDGIYIRNIDRFMREYQHQLNRLEREFEYYSEQASSFNRLLSGTNVRKVEDFLMDAQSWAATAADKGNQIRIIEYNVEMLVTNEQEIRNNSREAEAAFISALDDLKEKLNEVRDALEDYYKECSTLSAENSVLFSRAIVSTPDGTDTHVSVGGVSTSRLVLIFFGPIFVGLAIGLCVAFLKKYLPVNKQ